MHNQLKYIRVVQCTTLVVANLGELPIHVNDLKHTFDK